MSPEGEFRGRLSSGFAKRKAKLPDPIPSLGSEESNRLLHVPAC